MNTRMIFLSAGALLALGCSSSSPLPDGGTDADAAADTGADTAVADTGVVDTGPVDTGPADTGPLCLEGATSMSPFLAQLNTDLTTYFPDDTIPLHASFMNPGAAGISFPTGAIDREAVFASIVLDGPSGRVTRIDGVTLPTPEWACPTSGRSQAVTTEANPPNVNNLVMDLSTLFSLAELGRYEARIELPFVTYSSMSGGMASEDDVEFCCSITSAAASFEIVERVAELITAGGTYDTYVVVDVTLAGAASGDYTFHVADPTAGSVEVRRGGAPVTTLSYVWTTTVHATDPSMFYTFTFPGLFSITVRKAGAGTQNLYGIDHSIFDGTRILRVP